MKSTTKYDYETIRREYVQGPEISVRALAAKHGIKSFSALQVQMDRNNWRQEREIYQKGLETKTLTTTAGIIAQKRAEITVDALNLIHAAIFKMAADMQDRWETDPEHPSTRVFVPGQAITPDGISKLLDRLLTLTGSASVITEQRTVDLTPVEQLPPDVARLLADIAGERRADPGAMGRSALPSAKAARPD